MIVEILVLIFLLIVFEWIYTIKNRPYPGKNYFFCLLNILIWKFTLVGPNGIPFFYSLIRILTKPNDLVK